MLTVDKSNVDIDQSNVDHSSLDRVSARSVRVWADWVWIETRMSFRSPAHAGLFSPPFSFFVVFFLFLFVVRNPKF